MSHDKKVLEIETKLEHFARKGRKKTTTTITFDALFSVMIFNSDTEVHVFQICHCFDTHNKPLPFRTKQIRTLTTFHVRRKSGKRIEKKKTESKNSRGITYHNSDRSVL